MKLVLLKRKEPFYTVFTETNPYVTTMESRDICIFFICEFIPSNVFVVAKRCRNITNDFQEFISKFTVGGIAKFGEITSVLLRE